ncbi:MAG: hypothetical protein GX557_13045 [Chloroflexi bacterium]|nr:hypothetical protein [Chloroflexota bacterium]
MNTLSRRMRIAKSWLASFFHKNWQPEHYPIYVRQQAHVPDELRWCACVLNWAGPVGLGSTEQGARTALLAELHAVAARRREEGKPMPRPGTRVPILFASTTRVKADPALLNEFIGKALGFGPGAFVFISDESTICDFGDDERVAEIRATIRDRFGVAVDEPEPVRIADVLEKIRRKRLA